MCKFFSFVTHARKPHYFDWSERQAVLCGDTNFDPDSHASIAALHGLDEDKCNKYEYNPLTQVFTIDRISAKRDDSEGAERWVRDLDFKAVVEPLIIKPIVHPLKVVGTRLCQRDKDALKAWANVWRGVGQSVWRSVWESVGQSVGRSVWESVERNVWRNVRRGVGRSVGQRVGRNVWRTVSAYIASFFDIPSFAKYQPLWDLWDRGFVPSFDGKTWRLHHGPDATIVYEWTPKS